MISRIKGVVTQTTLKSIEVAIPSGLSFEICAPKVLSFTVGLLYDFFIVMIFNAEKGYSLYGFIDEKDKIFFKELQECRGVGPKLALTIIEHISRADFYKALVDDRKELLSCISGIGKKKAEIIVLELKSKIPFFMELIKDEIEQESFMLASSIEKDLEEALLKMGFQKQEAKKMIEKTRREKKYSNASLSELLSFALGG
jgi:Holliday junction DNA helicase RuvA